MAKLKNPLLSLEAIGRLAKSLSLKCSRGINILEKTPAPKDAKSIGQLEWRHMYQKAIALWHALSASEKQEWESLARPKHMTGFAWFISQALKPNPGLYLPLQGGTMSGNIDMAKHFITQLPAPTDDQHPVTKKYFEDNLPVGGYTEGARVYHDAEQAIPHATWTTLAFNSERYDTNTTHDNVTNNSRLTCKTAGKYAIGHNIVFYGNATGERAGVIRLNGSTVIGRSGSDSTGPNSYFFTLMIIYNLAVDDYVEVQVYQSSTGVLNILSVAQYTPEFMMQRIG